MTGGGVAALLDDLARRGGTATAGALRARHGRAALDRAVEGGEVCRLAYGVYGLPAASSPLLAAASVRGVVSHTSAARLWLVDPVVREQRVSVTVPPTASRRSAPGVRLHWSTLQPDDVVDGRVTAPLRTTLDCARSLPFAEGLAVADGFLRRGLVTRGDLVAAAVVSPARGRARATAVAAAADGRSANPFESALRAAVLEGGAGEFVPQVEVRTLDHGWVRPDLVDLGRRLALEADSFAWHGSRSALAADCRRYNALVATGFLVLRFPWELVMGDPARVAADVRAVVDLVDGRRVTGRGRSSAGA